MIKEATSKPTLKNGIIYSYAMGEFGYNFFITFAAYYLSFFLTNIAGFSMVIAATMITLTNVIKWVTMPIAGTIIDANKIKGGKYRPWMLIGSCLMLVAGTLCFTKLPMPANVGYSVVYLIFFAICYIGYGLMWVSYRALMGPMSKTPQDKVALSTASSQMGAVARIFFVFGAVNLVKLFASEATGYSVATLLFNIIMVVCMIIVARSTKEYDNDLLYVQVQTNQQQVKEKLTGKEIWDNLTSQPMLVFIFSMLFRISVVAIVPTLLVYYMTFVVQDYESITIYMMVTYIVQVIGASFVRVIANKFGKKPTFIWSTIISAIFLILVKFFGITTVPFIILMSLWQFTGIFAAALVPAFMADIAEYGQLTKGSKAAGFAYSMGGLVTQVGAVLGAAIAAYGMVVVGFEAASPSAAGITGLANLMTYASAGVSIISAILFFLYPLSDNYLSKLRTESTAQKAIAQ